MVVLTVLVVNRQLDRVQVAAANAHRVLRASSVSEACELLREQHVDVLVIDPIVGAAVPRVAASTSEVFGIGFQFPYVPVVFYVSNAAKALPIIARFPNREQCDLW